MEFTIVIFGKNQRLFDDPHIAECDAYRAVITIPDKHGLSHSFAFRDELCNRIGPLGYIGNSTHETPEHEQIPFKICSDDGLERAKAAIRQFFKDIHDDLVFWYEQK